MACDYDVNNATEMLHDHRKKAASRAMVGEHRKCGGEICVEMLTFWVLTPLHKVCAQKILAQGV